MSSYEGVIPPSIHPFVEVEVEVEVEVGVEVEVCSRNRKAVQ